MDGFNDTIAFDRKRIEEVHTNLARADEELVFDLVAKLAKRSRDVLHLDDLTVYIRLTEQGIQQKTTSTRKR